MVGLSITPHLHFLLHQYVIIHLVRTQAIGNPRSHLQTANGNFKKYERKSYLFCSILESAVVRSEIEVVLRCENYVQVDALTVFDRLSKKCLVGFHIARDEELFILDWRQFYRPKNGSVRLDQSE